MTCTYITILLYPSFKICFFPTSSWCIHFIPPCSHHFTPHHTTFTPPSDRRCVSAWLPSVGCCHPGGPADGMPMGRWWENMDIPIFPSKIGSIMIHMDCILVGG